MAVRMRKLLARPWVGVRVCHLLLLRSNSLRSTERKLFYPSIPVIMRRTKDMVGYASGSKCSLIFYITLFFLQ